MGFWILFQCQREKETMMLFKRGGKKALNIIFWFWNKHIYFLSLSPWSGLSAKGCWPARRALRPWAWCTSLLPRRAAHFTSSKGSTRLLERGEKDSSPVFFLLFPLPRSLLLLCFQPQALEERSQVQQSCWKRKNRAGFKPQ